MTAGYDKLVVALKERLQAKILDAHGRETGFIRRLRTVGASDFVWAVVLSRFATGIPGFDRAREIFHSAQRDNDLASAFSDAVQVCGGRGPAGGCLRKCGETMA